MADVDQLQVTLRSLLNSYVNGLYLRRMARYGYPVLWELSPYAIRQAIQELVRAVLPLRQNPPLTQWLDRLKNRIPDIDSSPEAVLAEALSEGYRHLSQVLITRNDTTPIYLPEAKPFRRQTYLELDRSYFRPVVALERYFNSAMSPYLKDAWIHGSVADLGLAKGYSDLDVLYVLSEEAVTNPERLRRFARACYRGHVYLYAFDHLQHHGFQVITAIDWLAYPESWLPLESLGEGVSLLRQTDQVGIRDSRLDAREAFERTVEDFVIRSRRGWTPSSAYEFKYFLSVLMLLPTLFWQAQDDFCTKPESFKKLAMLDVTLDDSILRTASDIRARWPDSRIVHIFSFLNPKVLGSLIAPRVRPMLDRFSGGMIEDAASFAVRLYELIDNTQSLQISHQGPSLSIIDDPVEYSLSDYASARECYVKQVTDQSGVLAVLECGTVSEPGLSDLDLVVLVDDDVPVNASALSIRGLSLAHADLIMHEPFVVPLSLALHMREWFPFAQFSVLLQRGQAPATLLAADSGADSFVETARLLEKLLDFRNWFSAATHSSIVSARWSLAVMKSLQHSVLTIERMTGTSLPAAASYLADLAALRAAWFGTDQLLWRRERLRTLHCRAEGLYQECVAVTEACLRTQMWLGAEFQNTTHVLERLSALYTRETPLAEVLGTAPGPAPTTPFEDYLSQRAAILARQQRFLRANGLTFGSLLL